MRSRFALVSFALLALAAGCRDLVTPEGAMNEGYPVLQLQVFGLGSDGALVDARVTIDNAAYVSAPYFASADTTTDSQGIASFEDIPPGRYDVGIATRQWRHSTPDWTTEGVVLGDSTAVVAYEGIPCTFEVDWPRVDEFAPAIRATKVMVSYPRDRDDLLVSAGTQIIFADTDGLFRGLLPWEGRFKVQVESVGPAFFLTHVLPDSLTLTRGELVALPSPVRAHPLELWFGNEPFTADRVGIEQRADTSSLSPGYGSIGYIHDWSTHPDSLFLVDTGMSRLTVDWVEGPAFLERTVWMDAGPLPPGVLDLARIPVTIRVTDEDSLPVAANVDARAEGRAESWPTDAAGVLELYTIDEPVGITVRAPGFESWESVVEAQSAQDIEVVLIREAP